MTIRNIGSKIISIGSVMLMPDGKISGLTDAQVSTPAINSFVSKGFIAVEDDTAAVAKETDTTAAKPAGGKKVPARSKKAAAAE